MRPSFRNRLLFVEQRELDIADVNAQRVGPIENLIWKSDQPDQQWIVETTQLIGNWRNFARSVYMRWAITINALNVARDRYAANPGIGLVTNTLRGSENGLVITELAIWPGRKAANNYHACIPLMAAYGVQDLYGSLEEIVFGMYELFIRSHAQRLMKGEEFKDLRRLHRNRADSAEAGVAWSQAFEKRLDDWRRKRAYDGLHRVFRAYCKDTKLSVPKWKGWGDLEQAATVIETVGAIRHLVTHGEDTVSKRLAELSAEQPGLGFRFTEGECLDVSLQDLMIVDNFINALLTMVNLALFEKAAGKPLPEPGLSETE